MYSTCIFCAGQLGRNEAIETFPVGKRLAFDAWRGRLWAVCPRCARWNLAPIEERWEAVEDAEKRFRAARLRVQSENVGLARLPDGTDLIRVGEALAGELAAWRYGEQLMRRHRRNLLVGGAVAATAGLGLAGLWAAGTGVAAIYFGSRGIASKVRQRRNRRTVHLLGADASPTGERLIVQEAHLFGARFELDEHDAPLLHLPRHSSRARGLIMPPVHALPELTLHGEAARTLVSRTMVHVNRSGGSRDSVRAAVDRLEAFGEADALIRSVARQGLDLGDMIARSPLLSLGNMVLLERGGAKPPDRRRRQRTPESSRTSLTRPELLSLEMALNEESERRALEGELAALEFRWREAEEIAAIADNLPDPIVLPK
jgi:hypothetical protein